MIIVTALSGTELGCWRPEPRISTCNTFILGESSSSSRSLGSLNRVCLLVTRTLICFQWPLVALWEYGCWHWAEICFKADRDPDPSRHLRMAVPLLPMAIN